MGLEDKIAAGMADITAFLLGTGEISPKSGTPPVILTVTSILYQLWSTWLNTIL